MMIAVNPRTALQDGFPLWLEEITAGSRVRQVKLDPFATSMRSCGRAVPWLTAIAKGDSLNLTDAGQALTDMNGAGLINREGGSAVPTALGHKTLSRWRELDIDNDADSYEIARCAVLLREALALDVEGYPAMYRFWCRLVSLQPISYWTQDVARLYLPSYLNRTDSRGYNPFSVLAAIAGGEVGSLDEWEGWRDSSPDLAGLEKLLRRVKGQRPGGRTAFCRAMEAFRVNRARPGELPAILDEWGVPCDH